MLKDLERVQDPACSFIFDPAAANDACDFLEKLPHVEGTWDTPNITLHVSTIFFVVNLFGFRDRIDTRVRRFSSALLALARKNSKSTIAAAILLYCFCCEHEAGPQIISAATTGDQAAIIFNIAKRMAEKSPELREEFQLEPFARSIVNWREGGSFKPINAKASTQDGLNPSHTSMDEIHAHKTHDLLNVLKSAAGARRNALWLYTTTEGYPNPGPWAEMRRFAQQVLEGLVEADHYFFLIYALDEEEGKEGDQDYQPADDDFDESKWPKANPLMEVNPVLAFEIRKAAIEAKQMPGSLAEFRIKRLNRQAAGARTWINISKWKRCAGAVNLALLQGKKCFGGLDGASTTDLMAFRLVWLIDDIYYTLGWRWVPAEAVAQRTQRGTVPYAGWVNAGLIRVQERETLDHKAIGKEIIEICKPFKVVRINYDPWNLANLVSDLDADGFKMEEFRQGPKSYHPAMIALEEIYVSQRLRHGDDAVLNWCASNLVPRYDDNNNMAPDKKRSPDKIDDACALLMGIAGWGPPKEKPRKHQLVVV